jgi:hypothetical protein
VGIGSNVFEYYFGTVSNSSKITCFFDPKPSIVGWDYYCGDAESKYINSYYFKLNADKTIQGSLFYGINPDNGQKVNSSLPFFGNSQGNIFDVPYASYRSDYDLIQWNKRGKQDEYCIDITDENWNVFPGFQAVKCGKNMANFSPADYVKNVMKLDKPVGLRFNWRVWSGNKDAQGNILPGSAYGGPGYEGKVIVQ